MVRVFVASNMPTSYPYKLQKPSTVNESVRETADTFIMDSGIGDDVSNEEVIDLAMEYDADYVVAKDYLHEHERTTDSIIEFQSVFTATECDAVPMLPLQPPYVEHYEQLQAHGVQSGTFVLGGMAVDSVTVADQLRWIESFRNVVPDAYVHGLGVGGGIEFVETVAKRGWLDSIDCSTPEQAAMFGKVLDKRLRQRDVLAFAGGDGKSRRTHPLAAFNSWQVQDVWDREATMSGLGDFETHA